MATIPEIADTDRLLDATATAAQTDFVITWPVIADSEAVAVDDLVVLIDGSVLDPSGYTFSGITVSPSVSGIWNGGTLTLETALSGGQRVIIYSDRTPRRTGNFLEGKALPFTELDKLTDDVIVQVRDLSLGVKRSLKVSVTDFADGETGDLNVTPAQIDAAVAAYQAGTVPAPSSDNIIHSDGGAGAVAVTVGDRLRWDVNVMDYIPKTYWAAIENGTINVDLGAYIHAARDARQSWKSGVVVPAGNTLTTSTALVFGGLSTRASTLRCPDGKAIIKAIGAPSHSSDMLTMRGFYDNIIPGRQYTSTHLQGVQLYCGNLFRDALCLDATDGATVDVVDIFQSYRNGVSLAARNGWIGACSIRDVLAASVGHHGIYLFSADGLYVNDIEFANCALRGFGFYSVPRFGIDAVTQTKQLGAAVYSISQAVASGTIDNIKFDDFTIDTQGSVAVGNGSQANPYPIVFANGQAAHVIEGAGVPGALNTFGGFVFDGVTRIEDVTASGNTGGAPVGFDSGATSTGVIFNEVRGGNYAPFSDDWVATQTGCSFASSEGNGGFARQRDAYLRRTKELRVTGIQDDANGKGLRLAFDTVNDNGLIESKDEAGGGTLKPLVLNSSRWKVNLGGSGGGFSIDPHAGSPEGVVVGDFDGALCIDNTNGKIYCFAGTPTQNTGWQLLQPAFAPCGVAQLPAANAARQGCRGFVTDANATTFMNTVAAGGANKVPVVCDGTNWKIG